MIVFETIVSLLAVALLLYIRHRIHRPKQFKPTRKWARTLYYNKLISMEELNDFYQKHPEKEKFDGTDTV